MSDQHQRLQHYIPAPDSTQLWNPPNDSQAVTSKLQQVDESDRDADFLRKVEVQFLALIQKSRLGDEVIESEYKRAMAECKEAYKDALSWRSVEHSNSFRDALGRLLGSLAVKKGMQRAEIFHLVFEAAEKRHGRPATTEYMDSSRADHLYEIAHQKAFPPGYPYHPLEPQQFRYLKLLPNESLSATPRCRLYRGEPADTEYAALSYVWG